MTDSAKQRQSNAVGAAREYYRLARESLDPPYPSWTASVERSVAQALLGILRVQIELIEGQWDTPCDCFAAMPEPEGRLTDQEFVDKVTRMRTDEP